MDSKTTRLAAFLDIEDGRLSSKSTIWQKYIWAPFWILGYWPIAISLAWNRLGREGLVVLAIPWLIVSVYFYCTLIRLKQVSMSGSTFIISNFRKEIAIDVSNIDSVGGSIFLNPELVWLNLKEESEFGKRIVFAPNPRSTFNICKGFTKHPLVRQLNSLCAIAKEV
jgi:hypothetical protein